MSKSTDNASAAWSKEKQYYLHKEEVQHPDTNTSSVPQNMQQQQQPSSQQHSKIEQSLSEDPTTQVAGIFASQPQIPYQHHSLSLAKSYR